VVGCRWRAGRICGPEIAAASLGCVSPVNFLDLSFWIRRRLLFTCGPVSLSLILIGLDGQAAVYTLAYHEIH